MQDGVVSHSSFGHLVIHVGRHWRRAVDQALAECGLSQATALPLLTLHRLGDHQRPGALADELSLEGPSLVRIIDRLVAEELITRREDPVDRRAKILSLTDAGRERVSEIDQVVVAFRQRILAQIPEEELAVTLSVLQRVEQILLHPAGQAG
jgi:MarR family transcriptional regulator for hemolysin